jgi:hypothetical protein
VRITVHHDGKTVHEVFDLADYLQYISPDIGMFLDNYLSSFSIFFKEVLSWWISHMPWVRVARPVSKGEADLQRLSH